MTKYHLKRNEYGLRREVQKVRLYGWGSLSHVYSVGRATAELPYPDGGTGRSGTYPEAGLLKGMVRRSLELLWEAWWMPAKGYSSPVIIGDRLYLTGNERG